MKRKLPLMIVSSGVLLAGAVALIWIFDRNEQSRPWRYVAQIGTGAATPKPTVQGTPKPVPAFQTAEMISSLPPTLDPGIFQGSERAGYQIAKEIPEVLAQIPCYCHCDKSIGHKSLHNCFADYHGASCGICQSEAMTAYKLRKEKKLGAKEIREKIIEQYSKQY